MDRKEISQALGVSEKDIDINVLPDEDLEDVAGGGTTIISITIIDDKAGGTAQ